MSDWKTRIAEMRESLDTAGVTRETLFPALPPELTAERAMHAADAEALFRCRGLLAAWLMVGFEEPGAAEELEAKTRAELNR